MKSIFITGGTSGIGKALALALINEGKIVIVSGRNKEKLDQLKTQQPSLHTVLMDVSNPQSIATAAKDILGRFPTLDTVINNAGIQNVIRFDSSTPMTTEKMSEEIDTNLKGSIFVTQSFLPHLKTHGGNLVFVSSGLAFVPLAMVPIYCATKAAIHSFCLSLRHQLKETKVRVIELIPPAVETELHRNQSSGPPYAMKLDEFISLSMAALKTNQDEHAIGMAKALRRGSRFLPQFFFKMMNKPRLERT